MKQRDSCVLLMEVVVFAALTTILNSGFGRGRRDTSHISAAMANNCERVVFA